MDDEWIHPLAKTLPFLVSNIMMLYCYGWLILDFLKKKLTNWWVTIIVTLQIYNLPKNLQRMTNNVELTFSVGEIALRLTISIEHDN